MEHQHFDERPRDPFPVERARRMFNRVLVTWAGDMLELRRRNLLVPEWMPAESALSGSKGAASQGLRAVQPMNDAA